MTTLNCEYVRDVYPEVLGGTADTALAASVRAHIADCAECRSEAALIEALYAQRLAAPAGLHERVLAGAAEPRARRRFSRSGMAMAATLAAALIGGSIIMETQQQRTGTVTDATRQVATPRGLGFIGVEDAMMTGHSSLDDLSVEQLEQLLGEMDS